MTFVCNALDFFINVTCPAKLSNDKEVTAAVRRDNYSLMVLAEVNRAIALLAHNVIVNYGLLLILCGLLWVLMYTIYKIFWDPVCYIKELSEVGFDHIPPGGGRSRQITRVQAARRAGSDLPSPYPNGWFAVAETRDLPNGAVITVDALGQNLCVYRGEDGIARIVDAYCPHLGANLGVGGHVCGASIVCPFHKWKFDADGLCIDVPEGEVPKGVYIKTWICAEADGGVWVWHDVEDRVPLWAMKNAPECRKWGYRGRNEFIVSAHIQDIPENGADLAHLNAIHSPYLLISTLTEKCPLLKGIIGLHMWNGSWKGNSNHTANITLTHDYTVLNYEFFHVELQISQIGPGHVRLRLQTPIGPFLLSQSVTPMGPLLQKVVHRLYSPTYNAPAASILIISEGKMIERDIRIWNSKRFLSAPKYVRGLQDKFKNIREYRTWYSQFYTDQSLTFRESQQNPFEW